MYVGLLQVVRKVWAYVHDNKLQNPEDIRDIMSDAVLKKFLTFPVDAISIRVQLKSHCDVMTS